jgi:hypothetical protein
MGSTELERRPQRIAEGEPEEAPPNGCVTHWGTIA